jgi:hypothetical protein
MFITPEISLPAYIPDIEQQTDKIQISAFAPSPEIIPIANN